MTMLPAALHNALPVDAAADTFRPAAFDVEAATANAKIRALGWPDRRAAIGCHRLRGGVTP